MSKESNIAWVIENIKIEGSVWRGFFASEIIMMNESDFNLVFPERNKQEERDKKINKILGI